MSCLCSTTSLKLFVRAVGRIDIGQSATAASASSTRQWRQRYRGGRTPTLTESQQGWRTFSAVSRRRDGEAERGAGGNDKGAVAALSIESIDELVAELNSQEQQAEKQNIEIENSGLEYAATPRERRRDGPKKHERQQQQREPRNRPSVRRTKAEPEEGDPVEDYTASRYPTKRNSKLYRDSEQVDQEAKKEHSGPKIKKERKDGWVPPSREHWQVDKDALKAKFPGGWSPLRRLSPDALAGIRALHAQMPTEFTTAALASRFEVSPEAIRRILKSKWSPNADEESDRARRWIERGKKVYERHVAEGGKAPKKWRDMGVGPGAGARARERKRLFIMKRNAETKSKRPLPALVTTARKRADKDRAGFGNKNGRDGEGLEGRIL